MNNETKTYTFTLFLDTGDTITVTIADDIFEEATEEFYEMWQWGDLWWIDGWNGLTAEYGRHVLDVIDLSRVIGMRYC